MTLRKISLRKQLSAYKRLPETTANLEGRLPKSRNVFTVSVYFFTLVVFLLTVVLIRRAQRFVDSYKKRQSAVSESGRLVIRFPLWKLALNVATFAGFYLFYVIWFVDLPYSQLFPILIRALYFTLRFIGVWIQVHWTANDQGPMFLPTQLS
ncbi:hypothetical protein KIN20_014397 [Parelaphostrongylus tenuis]|uniref:Uncharacterized protein n=1 Tax=Parelaphostrongylus tenuis TaxID=148309 RepID=A0AAD5MZH4_PARTN|nr:hypothetical protein KIN20_014397 [Parelaphostrongylus tenuis]